MEYIYIYLIVTSTFDNTEASITQAISKDLRAPAKENSKESEAIRNMYNNKKKQYDYIALVYVQISASILLRPNNVRVKS